MALDMSSISLQAKGTCFKYWSLVYRLSSNFLFYNQRHQLASIYDEYQEKSSAVHANIFDFKEINHLDIKLA